ncbi:hypothetical protein HYH03_006579 [Edaphochlamys debaryana]|uniref:Uncharacterized protein n=1 Tax=Edaphochlamys debaryana TaxID=47281 RepID=A0A835Y546_9CHLO|nr:hypothetical protein HYH03_006579 [Edaphochlamys debaryana]|eukprot:KAG2495307.1 hypothetical protein HYH03_006579 [Edaphochlamys debaryana]
MGKSRGGKYRPKGRGPKKGPEDEDGSGSGSEEEVQRPMGQRANVGMLPPSDSEEEEGEEGAEAKPKEAKPKEAAPSTSKEAGGQSKTAGKLPPNSDDEGSDDDDSSDDDDPTPEYLKAAPVARKKEPEVEVRTEEQVRKDLERLELIRKKREDDRLKRIATEGWDRYAPVSETNKPPGSVPSDHPSKAK